MESLCITLGEHQGVGGTAGQVGQDVTIWPLSGEWIGTSSLEGELAMVACWRDIAYDIPTHERARDTPGISDAFPTVE